MQWEWKSYLGTSLGGCPGPQQQAPPHSGHPPAWGTRQLGQREKRDPSPHSIPPSGQGIPGHQGGLQRSLCLTDNPHLQVIPFLVKRQDLLEWRWGSPQEKHKDTPNALPPLQPELSCGGLLPAWAVTHCGCNFCHNPDLLLHKSERALDDGRGREKRPRKTKSERERARERESEQGKEKDRRRWERQSQKGHRRRNRGRETGDS